MVYVDTSVVLAQLFAEDRLPPAALWANPLITSRLLAYETWTRVHARNLSRAHGEKVHLLLGRLAFVELHPQALARALEPFPVSVRTLDALHLASIEFLRSNGQVVELATYDDRLRGAARAIGVPLFDL